MMINITRAEYDAIMFAREQITSCIEGASDDGYVNEANEAVNGISSVQGKYRKALAKHENMLTAKRAVKHLHPELSVEMQNKLAKIAAKQLNNEKGL